MSKKAIIDYFKSHRSLNICGKLKAYQLKTYHTSVSFSINNQCMRVAFIAGFNYLVSFPINLQAQSITPIEQVHSLTQFSRKYDSSQSDESFIIKGNVTEENSVLGLPGVIILLKGTNNAVITDLDGNFEIEIIIEHQNPILQFSFIGLITEERVIANWKDQELIVLTKDDTSSLLGDKVVEGVVRVTKLVWY